MSNQVYANNMEVSCKQAAGKSICAFPDVCMTPPMTPATPPGVPIPYPNTGMASDSTDGSSSVKISGQEVMLKNKSYFKKSMGDEAGCAPKKGVVTSKNMGKVYFIAWSMDVLAEGENVVRNLDMTTHNHGSCPGNTTPMAYIDEAIAGLTGACKEEREAIEKACGKKGAAKRGDPCPGPLGGSKVPMRDDAFADQASMMPQVKAGKLRALAVGGARRSDEYPEIPTVAEAASLPGFEAVAWQGIAGPAGLPPAIVNRLHDAFAKTHAAPGMRERLAGVGLTSVGGTPQDFGRYIRSEIGKWTKVAKDVGVTVD